MLLLDVGNSRLKWALWDGPRAPGSAAGAHGTDRFQASGVLALPTLMGSRRSRALDRVLALAGVGCPVRICSVAGAAIEARLRATLRGAGLGRPRFERSDSRAAGVRNGYREPWRLGADRWVGLIGARWLYPREAVCIASVGTALTVDLLDARGRHRGGCLLPGLDLMIEAVLMNTAGVARRAGTGNATRAPPGVRTKPARRTQETRAEPSPFARDTRAGLLAGTRLACAALIERAFIEATRLLGHKPLLILTGGAAREVGAALRRRYVRADELVLHGLAVLAELEASERAVG